MSVFKRSTTAGATAEYHYKFMQGGKYYFGVCEGCTTKAAAEEYEKNIKGMTKQLSQQKSARALAENFRDTLTGGIQISIESAFDLSLKKPKKKKTGADREKFKRAYWNDFTAFMKAKHSDIQFLSNVKLSHAEEYLQYLITNGRFNKNIVAGSKKAYSAQNTLSATSINQYRMALAEVFKLLFTDAGIIENPFSGIDKLTNTAESREAFSRDEINLIVENDDSFSKPLFIIAIATALREGDICLLKWDDVDLKSGIINRRMKKTGHLVQIPIMPHLKMFFIEQFAKTGTQEYVLPEQAKMYLENRQGVSYRVKAFLESLGIQTTKTAASGGRNISIKDLHSCRHTFCYLAGYVGIPLNIVQSIVGHMTPEMTKHYSAHATIQDKQEKIKLLADFMDLKTKAALPAPQEDRRAELIRLIDSMSDDAISRNADIIKKLSTAAPGVLDEIEKILKLR